MTKLKCLTIMFAEFALMVLGIVALDNGLDGALFISVIAAISGLGGYTIKKSDTINNG